MAAVETLADELWKGSMSAVVNVPDARKGEKLILVTDRATATRAELLAFAKTRGAVELMVPAEVRVVAKVPVLGSGKVDLVTVGKMVRGEASTNPKAA